MSVILEFLKVVLLGVVEGITEWHPISSTGHMILVNEFVKLNVSDAFMEMFLVVIQLGAILAVCVLYFRKLNPWDSGKNEKQRRDTFSLWGKVIVGCIPAGVIGDLFNDTIDALFYNPQTVAFTLILYGILFIVVENHNKGRKPTTRRLNDLTYRTAILIGCFQLLSLIPGTSRSGSTILGAMILGTSRYVAAEYSFFLSIPVMFGASLLKIVKYGFHYSGSEILYLIGGMVIAFVVSILAIKFLIGYIKKNDFKAFGVYRIVLGLLVAVYFIVK